MWQPGSVLPPSTACAGTHASHQQQQRSAMRRQQPTSSTSNSRSQATSSGSAVHASASGEALQHAPAAAAPTGDSLPVPSTSDFQIIRALVMIMPAFYWVQANSKKW